MSAVKRIAFALGLPLALVAVWWLLTLNSQNAFVPQPVPLAQTFVDVWVGERFFTEILPSLQRLSISLLVAISLGIVVGVAIGSTPWLRALTEPLLEFFRAIPPPVLVPVLMLLLGITDQMKIVVIVFGAVWPVLLNTIEGVRAVDSVLLDNCRTYQISGRHRLLHLVLPGASPQIMTGVRQSLSIGLILMVISEMFAATSGLGFTILRFQRSFAVPEMWSGIVVLGILGVTLSFLFQWVERRLLRWYHGVKEAHNAS